MASIELLATANELFIRRRGSDDWYAFWIDGSESRSLRFGKKGACSSRARRVPPPPHAALPDSRSTLAARRLPTARSTPLQQPRRPPRR